MVFDDLDLPSGSTLEVICRPNFHIIRCTKLVAKNVCFKILKMVFICCRKLIPEGNEQYFNR